MQSNLLSVWNLLLTVVVFITYTWLQDKEPKGIIPLENIQVREVAGDRSKPNSFELYSASNEVIKACKTDSEGKVIEGLRKICYMHMLR